MNHKEEMYNRSDQKIWDEVFSNVPSEWKSAEASDPMIDCLNHFRKHKVRSVLDLGCGIGLWAMFLSKSGLKVTGIDFSEKAIDFARGWAREENQDIIYECSPIADQSPDESFDGILAAKILDNISRPELEKVRNRISRSLNNQGILYGLFNPFMTTKQIEKLMQSDNPTKGVTSVNFSDDELKKLFPGFRLMEFKVYDFGFRGLTWQKVPD